MKTDKNTDVWLTTKETAKYLKISAKAVQNMVSRGDLKRYKLGRRNRFLKSDIRKAVTEF